MGAYISSMRTTGYPYINVAAPFGFPQLPEPHDGSIYAPNVAQLAQWDTIIFNITPTMPWQRPDLLAAIRTANPKIRVFGYFHGSAYPKQEPGITWSPGAPEFNHDVWAMSQAHPDGKVKCLSGVQYNLNLADTPTVEAFADIILSYFPGPFDGLYADVICQTGFISDCANIDYAGMGYGSAGEWRAAYTIGHNLLWSTVRAGLPAGFPMIGNCGLPLPFNQTVFNGWMRENFPFQGYQGNSGVAQWDAPLPLNQANGWHGNMVCSPFNPASPGYLVSDFVDPEECWLASNPGFSQASSKQKMIYGQASACLSGGFHSVALFEFEPARYWWYPEYDNNGAGKGWLGRPLASYVADRGTSDPTSAYYRKFTKGAVIVNPSSGARTVDLGESYRSILSGGNSQTFDVNPSEGLFLIKA